MAFGRINIVWYRLLLDHLSFGEAREEVFLERKQVQMPNYLVLV